MPKIHIHVHSTQQGSRGLKRHAERSIAESHKGQGELGTGEPKSREHDSDGGMYGSKRGARGESLIGQQRRPSGNRVIGQRENPMEKHSGKGESAPAKTAKHKILREGGFHDGGKPRRK
jgi:hypothetical protein